MARDVKRHPPFAMLQPSSPTAHPPPVWPWPSIRPARFSVRSLLDLLWPLCGRLPAPGPRLGRLSLLATGPPSTLFRVSVGRVIDFLNCAESPEEPVFPAA